MKSGIANVTSAIGGQGGARTLADAFGDRVVLGVGIGHQSTAGRRGQEWANPVGRMEAYLDAMDAARMGPTHEVPVRRLLAALGPRMLTVAAERALGAHTYFVPIEHTMGARSLLGPEPVLAVEQTAIASADPATARGIARSWAAHYLELPNYANNWRRLGYGDDLGDGGSDRLIDAAIAWGDVSSIAGASARSRRGRRSSLRAGIFGRDDDLCLPALRELAAAVLEPSR